jgi:YD repeat-containing protein
MDAPSPPPTPDPYKVSAAQQLANVEVADANRVLLNPDEDRPDGTKRIVWLDEWHPTYTYDENGNVTGQRDVRRHKVVTSLTPKGQEAYEIQQDITIATNLSALALTRTLREKMASPFSLSMLPERAPTPSAPAIVKSVPQRPRLIRDLGDPDGLLREKDTVREQLLERLTWQVAEVDRGNALSKLRHQGIPEGSPAHERAMRRFDQSLHDARLQVETAVGQEHSRLLDATRVRAEFHNSVAEREWAGAVQAIELMNALGIREFELAMAVSQFVSTVRNQAMQEFIAERSQTTNEISVLMRGGQVSLPQFQPYQAKPMSDTPVSDNVWRAHAADVEKWKQQGQMFGGMMALLGNVMSAPMTGGGSLLGNMMSDRRVKTDIVRVADDVRGFGWYLWRYMWDRPGVRRFGVMAQDVTHMPGAVTAVGGLLTVDYRRLG